MILFLLILMYAGMKVGSWWGMAPMVLVVLVLALNYAEAQLGGSDTNPCTSKLNCSECIRTPTCAWCAQPVRGILTRLPITVM